MACFLSSLLPGAVGLFEPVETARLSLRLLEGLGSLIELPIKQLSLVEQVTQAVAADLRLLAIECRVSTQTHKRVLEHLPPHMLLEPVQLQSLQVPLSRLTIFLALESIGCKQGLVLFGKVIHGVCPVHLQKLRQLEGTGTLNQVLAILTIKSAGKVRNNLAWLFSVGQLVVYVA